MGKSVKKIFNKHQRSLKKLLNNEYTIKFEHEIELSKTNYLYSFDSSDSYFRIRLTDTKILVWGSNILGIVEFQYTEKTELLKYLLENLPEEAYKQQKRESVFKKLLD